MRVGISNIAFPESFSDSFLAKLSNIGVSGVEVALTRIAPWEDLSALKLNEFKSRLASHGLDVPSLQALFYSMPEAQLLGDQLSFQKLLDHIKFVSEAAAVLGAGVGVFGAPRNRLRKDMPFPHAMSLACERLGLLADECRDANFKLGLEPVPKPYGGDFLLNSAEVLNLVHAVNHPYLGVHLDVACAFLADENIGDAICEAKDTLVHFHASEDQLADFSAPSRMHDVAASALEEIGYCDWCVVEMRQPEANCEARILQASNFAIEKYGQSRTASQ